MCPCSIVLTAWMVRGGGTASGVGDQDERGAVHKGRKRKRQALTSLTVSAILSRQTMTARRRRQNAETVTLFSISDGLEPVSGVDDWTAGRFKTGGDRVVRLVSPRIPTTMGSSPRIPMSYSLSSISPSLRCLNGSEAGRSDSRWMRERREPQILLYLPGGHCQPQDDSSPAGRNEKVYVLVIIFSILDMIPTHHFDLSHRRILLPLSCELSSAGVHDK
jgi:hypothetical protein